MTTSYRHPFASSPDIIRSHQKDAYFTGTLLEHLSSLLRRTHGARIAHQYTSETRTVAELLYFSLTTLLGNRTLGEEYCDIIQVDDSLRMPSIFRRASYILFSIGFPYSLSKLLPAFRRRIRAALERSLQRSTRKSINNQPTTPTQHLQTYILTHLSTLTSPSPLHALILTFFYFTGTHYHLSKRLLSLRYIFTRNPAPSDARIGYEVLGVLLVLQLGVQAYLHVHSTVGTISLANAGSLAGTSAPVGGGAEVSLNPHDHASNNALLIPSASSSGTSSTSRLATITATPSLAVSAQNESLPRITLADKEAMEWIGAESGDKARKCTLCLEEMRDPSVTPCGHTFCWGCIGDWVRERAECPLCRQGVLGQHILPLRG